MNEAITFIPTPVNEKGQSISGAVYTQTLEPCGCLVRHRLHDPLYQKPTCLVLYNQGCDFHRVEWQAAMAEWNRWLFIQGRRDPQRTNGRRPEFSVEVGMRGDTLVITDVVS